MSKKSTKDSAMNDLPPLQFGREHVGHGMLRTGDIDLL